MNFISTRKSDISLKFAKLRDLLKILGECIHTNDIDIKNAYINFIKDEIGEKIWGIQMDYNFIIDELEDLEKNKPFNLKDES
jgi:hypothetical protein